MTIISKKRKYLFYKGIRYASEAEISCAKALTKYCAWSPIEGETYQRSIGHGKQVDFVVNGDFIEFHPIILSRELNKDCYNALRLTFKGVRADHVRQIRAALRCHLLEAYCDKREWTMRLHSDAKINSADLVVVTDADDFYTAVIKPNSTIRLPSKKQFIRMFRAGKFQ